MKPQRLYCEIASPTKTWISYLVICGLALATVDYAIERSLEYLKKNKPTLEDTIDQCNESDFFDNTTFCGQVNEMNANHFGSGVSMGR